MSAERERVREAGEAGDAGTQARITPSCTRRSALLAGAAAATSALLPTLAPSDAWARGRTPVGGRVTFRLPWPLSSVDPHRIDDPAAALFGEALFDTLYVLGEGGAPTAVLAEAEPEPEGANLRVRLRAGLRTAKGRAIEPRDVAAAIERARGLGARAWLTDVPAARVSGNALLFSTRDASRLVRALSSPLVAVVPPGYSPESPDGTGPLRWRTQGDAVVLAQNPLAARGPSMLDEVIVRAAPSVAASLRAFQSLTDDVGWLGSGVYAQRGDSKPFDFGAVAYAVLFTGRDAQAWDAPGVAQRLCDGIPPSRLAHLAVGPAWTADALQTWGGPPAALYVRDDAPWMIELAQAIAATVSQPSHEVTARPIPPAELAQRRAARSHALALDVVRPVERSSLGAMIALATSDGAGRAAELVKKPPKIGEQPARSLTRTMRCGVVGEIRVSGGYVPDDVVLAASPAGGFDLGASFRLRGR